MRLLTGSIILLLYGSAALADTLVTPAGKIELPPPHSWEHYVNKNPTPAADQDVSWGKAGVSFSQYHQDKIYCGFYALQHALKTPAWAMHGHHTLEAVIHKDYSDAQLRQSGREEIEHCLILLGYSRFRLTPQQLAQLEALAYGTPDREIYLYTLASDATVLNRQKV